MPKNTKKLKGISLLLKIRKDKQKTAEQPISKDGLRLCSNEVADIIPTKKRKPSSHRKEGSSLQGNIFETTSSFQFSSPIINPAPPSSAPVHIMTQGRDLRLTPFEEQPSLHEDIHRNRLRVPVTVSEICSPYLPEEFFVIYCKDAFMEGYYNPTSMMDVNSINGYIVYCSYLASNYISSIVININYTVDVYNGSETCPTNGAWGNADNFDVMFIPIYFHMHYALVIHEKGGRTIFYDPLPEIDRLQSLANERYLPAIRRAVTTYDHAFQNDLDINIEWADRRTYNLQSDNYNCGYFVCLYVETFLMNDRRMLLSDFNIATERQRISTMIRDLCNNIVPQYEARDDNPFHEETIHTFVEEDQTCDEIPPVECECSIDTSEIGSSISIRRTPNYSRNDTFPPLRQCKRKKHGIYGCFAKSAVHNVEYLDCGKIGDKECPYCKAKLFSDEESNICCAKGSVKLPEIQKVPDEISLLIHDATHGAHFRQYFRIYNMLLRFGSLDAGRKRAPGNGPPVLLINGEIKRNISPLFAADGKTPIHGQLYMLDPMTMCEETSRDPLYSKFGIRRELLERLFNVLRAHHPLCESYAIMHQLYEEKLSEARQQGRTDVQHVTLVLINPRKVPQENVDPGLHPRSVNLPQVNEICAFYVSNDENEPLYRHGTWLKKKDGHDKLLPLYDRLSDCTHYVLNLARGDYGFHLGIPKHIENRRGIHYSAAVEDSWHEGVEGNDGDFQNEANETENTHHVSIREFYRYHLAIRGHPTGSDHFLYPYGSIVQEYIIDQSIKVDQQIFEYIKKHQDTFCTVASEVRQALENNLQKMDERKKLGKVIRLSSRMVGTPAWYQQQFHDAMALFHRVGRPTFMITSTSNPTWKEVKENIMARQNVTDRPDIVNRVFSIKIKKMRQLIEKKCVFGKVKAFVESLEFQKRGGPHTHKLINVECPNTPEYVDEYVCAEIPLLPQRNDNSGEANMTRKLHELVIRYQVHNCNAHCLNENGKCCKGFPKPYAKETIIYEDRPAIYRRRSPDDGGAYYKNNNGSIVTNAIIVPYNPSYLMAWNAHCNIEYCYGTQACKYAVKYHFKMGNFAYVQIAQPNSDTVDYDESKGIMKGHYRSAPEAYTRLYCWRIIRMSHTVQRLDVHLPGEGPLYFRRGFEEKLAAQVFQGNTKLTRLEAFMKQCGEELQQSKCEIRNFTYPQLPETYWFNVKANRWAKRKRSRNVIGRLYPVTPKQTEKFAIYQLLLHKKGPTSWEDLRTPFEDMPPCETFIECAKALGLLDDVEIWRKTLFEASNVGNPWMMRNLFCQIILLGHVSDPLQLWNEFLPHMYDTRNLHENDRAEKSRRINVALCLLNRLLGRHWKTNNDFGIPMPTNYEAVCDDERDFFFNDVGNFDEERVVDPTVTVPPHFVTEVVGEDIEEEHVTNYVNLPIYLQLNVQQRTVVDCVMRAIETPLVTTNLQPPPRLIFMNGAGGTGKTFVYNVIIKIFNRYTKYAIVTASTGAAAQLLPRGTTVHSAFRLPIDIASNNRVPAIQWNSVIAQRIRKSQLLIIDEISMLHKVYFKMVDEACRHTAFQELSKYPFGGKVVLIGGDWRQLLPVIQHGDMIDQVMASVKNSEIFQQFHQINLTTNMRVDAGELEFVQLLEAIGEDSNNTGVFNVPPEMLVNSEQELIRFVFENGEVLFNDEDVGSKLLLSARRADVRNLNDRIMNMLPGREREYLSADKSLVDNPVLDVHAAIHDVASLNEEIPSGFPPHRLKLKERAIVVLLSNIDVRQGLSNGTRLIITSMGEHLLHTKIATGPYRGRPCTLSMLPFTYEDKRPDGTGMHFKRIQFPVDLAYAMTINKAQGQTVSKVGLLLKQPLFSHGQLYVALSRARTARSIRILLPEKAKNVVKNVVAKRILS